MDAVIAILDILSKVAEGTALLASILFYSKYKHTALKFLPIVLGYMFLLEIFGVKLYHYLDFNALFYNVFNLCFYLFFFYVFYYFLHKRSNKKGVIILVGIFIISLIVDLITFDFVHESLLYSYITGGCLIVICVILYFLEMLNSSRVLSLRQDLLFWMGIGLLLFYMGYIPVKITRLYFASEQNTFMTLLIMHQVLIIILYGCFTAGLLWKMKK